MKVRYDKLWRLMKDNKMKKSDLSKAAEISSYAMTKLNNDRPVSMEVMIKLYRYGAYRVGCKLCPMASEWYECVLNHIFPEEVKPLLDIVSTSITKSFSSDEEKKKYLQSGGWKSRIGGKELSFGGNKITEIKAKDSV